MNGDVGWWTDARVDRLKELWGDGFSCSQIAEQMCAVSRSAIIGKVHRLKLNRSGVNIKPVDRTRQHQRTSKRVLRDTKLRNTPVAPTPPKPAVRVEKPKGQPVTILQLNEHTCRYPLWDTASDPRTYCGEEPVSGSVYCRPHDRHCRPGAYA